MPFFVNVEHNWKARLNSRPRVRAIASGSGKKNAATPSSSAGFRHKPELDAK
jgi:hypothetical protein